MPMEPVWALSAALLCEEDRMNNGNGNSVQPWQFQGDLASALWMTWWLWSLQTIHEANRTFLNLTMGSLAGSLKLTRSYYESVSENSGFEGNTFEPGEF